jgi:hypothetical protein
MSEKRSEADMPDLATTTRPRGSFVAALFAGLLWGIAGATMLSGLAPAVLAASGGIAPLTAAAFLETMVWTAMFASILAVFPIGPVAAVIGWQVYRRGVVARWAYAAVGALSALVAPVLILTIAIQTTRYPTTNSPVIDEPAVPLIGVAFAVIGAFAGFMAGRVIRRAGAAAS